jgi:hypothetical protein
METNFSGEGNVFASPEGILSFYQKKIVPIASVVLF